MKKYLDILIFTLLFFFIFSYISGNGKQETPTGFQFSSLQSNYKVPAGIGLSFGNYTAETVSFNSCSDLSIRHEGKTLNLPEKACEDITVEAGEVYNLDLAPYYSNFETPWLYTFDFAHGEAEYTKQIEVSYRGTIAKTFVGLFYAPMYNLMIYLIHFFGTLLGLQ